MARLPKTRVFWPILLTLLIADCASKKLAETYLAPEHTPHEVVGSVVRLTLAHNVGAAMGLSLGPYSRLGFSLAALLVCSPSASSTSALPPWPACVPLRWPSS